MPVEISDWNELDNVRNDLSSDYVLIDDLDESTAGYDDVNSGSGWNPIDSFTGTFDGQNHTIKALFIDRNAPVGLFGTGLDAIVENLGLVNVDITSGEDDFTGYAGLVAESLNGLIENCFVTGSVTQTNSDSSRTGGLVGFADNDGGEITNCFTFVHVRSEGETVGGFVAQNQQTITNCWSIGKVNGAESNVAGFCGRNQATLEKCYSVGSVDEGTDNFGGFTGQDNTEIDCYWDTQRSGQDTDGGDATGLATAEMQGSSAPTNMSGFDFDTVWEIVEDSDSDTSNDGYPILNDLDRQTQLIVQGADTEPFRVWRAIENGSEVADLTF